MIRGIIYIVIFIAGFAAGGVFPSFSTQYHQRLQAQFDQVSIDLAPFHAIADQFHGGSMPALVQHHLDSSDPTFRAEGQAIQAMIDNQTKLAESKAAAEAPYVAQAIWLYRNRDETVVRRTWEDFEPILITSENAVTFSLTIATALLVLAWLITTLISSSLRRMLATKRTPTL